MNRREVAYRSFSFEINEANYKVEGGRGEEKNQITSFCPPEFLQTESFLWEL
jgi:hypothetical protein